MKKEECEGGKYYHIANAAGEDKCLVYCYKNPDYSDGETLGFGFNIADGSAWMPLWELTDDTVIVEVEIKPVIKRDLGPKNPPPPANGTPKG